MVRKITEDFKMQITQKLVPQSKYSIKCPHAMTPHYITIHNTSNNASAENEVNYMISNDNKVSCHIFVDDIKAIQTIPFNRNAWHCGDGADGLGNRQSIGVEICYSTDYTSDKYYQACLNAVDIVKWLMAEFDIPIENVVQHNHWSGKDCPHRIREDGTWEEFIKMVKGEVEMGLKNGYQTLTWNKQKVHVYKLSGGEKMSVYALPYGETCDITKANPERKKIKAIVSGVNYFDMVGKTNQILGGYQGLNCNEATLGKGEPCFDGYNGTDDKPYTDLAVYKDGSIVYGDFNSWEHRDDNVQFRVSPAGVQLDNGEDKNWFSPAVGYAKITNANTQTLLLKCDDGSFALAVVSGKLSPLSCRTLFKNCGVLHQSCYDSGGSSQMVVDGEKKVYTGRKCPIYFVIYEEENNAENSSNQATEETSDLEMTVDSVGVRIRKTLNFKNGKASGRILKTLKIGEKAEVLELIEGIQADGYQWVKAKSDNIIGYAQYDSQCYWLSKKER